MQKIAENCRKLHNNLFHSARLSTQEAELLIIIQSSLVYKNKFNLFIFDLYVSNTTYKHLETRNKIKLCKFELFRLDCIT